MLSKQGYKVKATDGGIQIDKWSDSNKREGRLVFVIVDDIARVDLDDCWEEIGWNSDGKTKMGSCGYRNVHSASTQSERRFHCLNLRIPVLVL